MATPGHRDAGARHGLRGRTTHGHGVDHDRVELGQAGRGQLQLEGANRLAQVLGPA
jgi:hypothetical protein